MAGNEEEYDSTEEFRISCIEGDIETTIMQFSAQDNSLLTKSEDTLLEWLIKVGVNNSQLSLKVDTGAQINVISQNDLGTLIPRPHIIPRTVRLKSYQGKSITTLSRCSLEIHSSEGGFQHFLP